MKQSLIFIIAAAMAFPAACLRADTVAEWQFNDGADLPGGSDIGLDVAAEGASTQSKLQEASRFVAGPTGISDKWPDFLASGYLESGLGAGEKSANQHGLVTGGDYGSYMGGHNLEASPAGLTVYLVVQPNSDWASGVRRGLFGAGDWVGKAPSTGAVRLMASEQTLQFMVGKGENGSGYDLTGDGDLKDFVAAQSTVNQAWDPAKWYFIAASAQEGEAPVLFVRELAADGPAASPAGITGTPTPTGDGIWDRVPMEVRIKKAEPKAVGAAWVSNGNNPQTQDGADAKIAYARLDNTFATAAQMDEVFASLDKRVSPGAAGGGEGESAHPKTPREQFVALQWDTSQEGRELDISQYTQTFNDDFKTMSVTHDETGSGPWYAPGHTDFGTGKFMAPGPHDTFTLVEDGLQIRADKGEKDQWRTGNIQTVNRKGEGFAQKYGYFEMTAKFPKGHGAWVGLWLLSQNGYTDKSQTRTEIDIIEWYGGDPKGHHPTVHLWPANGRFRPADATITKRATLSGFKQGVGRRFFQDMLVDGGVPGFHSYGGEITPEWVIIYVDRKEVARIPAVDEFETPLYMVITMALIEKDIAKAVAPIDLIIRNASAYQPKTPYSGR